MERAIVRDQVPTLGHVGYSDGVRPLPKPSDREEDLVMATRDSRGEVAGLRPWESSLGVSVRGPLDPRSRASRSRQRSRRSGRPAPNAGAWGSRSDSTFLPYAVAEKVVAGLPRRRVGDARGSWTTAG